MLVIWLWAKLFIYFFNFSMNKIVSMQCKVWVKIPTTPVQVKQNLYIILVCCGNLMLIWDTWNTTDKYQLIVCESKTQQSTKWSITSGEGQHIVVGTKNYQTKKNVWEKLRFIIVNVTEITYDKNSMKNTCRRPIFLNICKFYVTLL